MNEEAFTQIVSLIGEFKLGMEHLGKVLEEISSTVERLNTATTDLRTSALKFAMHDRQTDKRLDALEQRVGEIEQQRKETP